MNFRALVCGKLCQKTHLEIFPRVFRSRRRNALFAYLTKRRTSLFACVECAKKLNFWKCRNCRKNRAMNLFWGKSECFHFSVHSFFRNYLCLYFIIFTEMITIFTLIAIKDNVYLSFEDLCFFHVFVTLMQFEKCFVGDVVGMV